MGREAGLKAQTSGQSSGEGCTRERTQGTSDVTVEARRAMWQCSPAVLRYT